MAEKTDVTSRIKVKDVLQPFIITDLPKEVQAYILCNLDGMSMARALRVCKVWRGIIQGFEQYFNIWLRCCIKDIIPQILLEITNFRDIVEKDESDSHFLERAKQLPGFFWHEVYCEYQRQKYMVTRKESMFEICFFKSFGNVTSLVYQDNQLFSGHEDGQVLCWRNLDASVESTICHKHQRMVTDMAVTTSGQSVNHLMLGINSTFVITSSQDSKIMVTDVTEERTVTVSHYSKQVNAVSCDGLAVVGAANGSFLQGHPVWDIDFDGDLTVQQRVANDLIGQESTNIVAIAIHNNTIITGDDIGCLYMYEWKDRTDTPQDHVTQCLKKFDVPVKKLHMQENLLVCFLENGLLCISRDLVNFNEFNIYNSVQRMPECFCLRGNILAIGTKSGKIYLYHTSNDFNTEFIDPSEPAKLLKVDADHINCIAMGDMGAGPFLAVATEHSYISIFKWTSQYLRDASDVSLPR